MSQNNPAELGPWTDCATHTTPTSTERTIAPLPVVRAAALQAASQPQPWLVEHLWTSAAAGVIGGSPKSGKSWLALDMAVAVASATPCLGVFPVHTSGPVLLYAAEDSTAALRARLQTLSHIRHLDFHTLDVRVITADSLRLDRLQDQERLEATVLAHQPVLLLIDPLVRVHAIDENVAGQVAALLGYLRGLQRKTGAAIALVHHVRKNPSSQGAGYNLRGSSDLYAWLDSFLSLRKHHDHLMLSAEHRSAPGAGPFLLDLAPPSGNTGPHLRLISADSAAAASAQKDTLPERIVQLLSAATEPMTVESLRHRLQVRNQRVVEALRHLCSTGAVQRQPRGYVHLQTSHQAPLPIDDS